MSNQPTVYEQQLIRDYGEDFKNRVKKAIKKFDSLNQSLQLSIRNLIRDILKEILQIEDDQTLINNFYFRYFTRYEDQHYRFMMQSLNYIFDEEKIFDFNDELNYKYIAIIFVEQIRNYLKDQSDKGLNLLWNKLNSIKKEKESDELQEGYINTVDDDDENYQQQNSKNKRNKIDDGNEFCHTRKEMQLKDMLIQSLQNKLIQRENNLVKITSGYLKELQALREQLFRKDQHLLNQEEFFEVNFMDFSEVLDTNIKNLFHDHILDLKYQFNNRIILYNKIIQAQKEEIRNHKNQIQKLQNQIDTIDGPSELLKKLFFVENNPYRIWKYISDQKGNFYFKEVFEQQKAVFGINYQEVNQLLMTNKAYEREYQSYKEQTLQEQLNILKTIQEGIEELKIKQVMLEQENQTLKNERQNDQIKFIEISTKNYEDKVKQEIEIMKEYYQSQVQDIRTQIISIDKLKIKFAFKLWVALAKIHKHEDIHKVLQEVQFFDDKLKTFQAKNKELESLLTLEQNTSKNLTAKLSIIEFETQKNAQEFNILKCMKKLQLLAANTFLEQQKNYIESQLKEKVKEFNLLNSFTSQMVRLIDQRLSQVKIIDINLDDHSKEVVKGFIKSIRELNLKSLRTVEEVRRQGQLNLETFSAMTEKIYKDQEVQTDIQQQFQILKTGESVGEENKKQYQSFINKSSNYASQDSKQKQSSKLEIQSESSQSKSQKKQKSQKDIPDNKVKPKLIVSSAQDYNENDMQKQEFEDQSTRLSPLKVLQNFEYKNFEQSKQNTPVEQIQEKQQQKSNKFKQYQEYQSEQVIQLLEVSEQIEQEQNIKSQNRDKIKRLSCSNPIDQEKTRKNDSRQWYSRQTSRKQNEKDQFQSIPNSRGSKSYRFRATSQLQQQSIPEAPQIFEKLYADSQEKSERIKSLKENLEMLEKSHWDDILNVFSQQPSGNYILKQCIPPKIKQEQFSFLETESFQKNKTKKYYDKTKSKTPTQDRYKSWIMKQTNCIDQLFNNLGSLNTIKEKREQDALKTQSLQYSTLLPDHLFNIQKKQNN